MRDIFYVKIGKTMKREVKAIVALDKNNGMSLQGQIPWRVKEDFQYFKAYTRGMTCVMGRVTYLDMLRYVKDPSDPLPGRKIIVIGVQPVENVRQVHTLSELNSSFLDENLVLCGGRSIYMEGFSTFRVVELSVTRIDGNYNCDSFITIPFTLTLRERFELCNSSLHKVEIYH